MCLSGLVLHGFRIWPLALLILVYSPLAAAEIILATAQPDGSRGAYGLGRGQQLAAAFSLHKPYRIQTAEGWIRFAADTSGVLTVSLHTDQTGLPGTEQCTATYNGAFEASPSSWYRASFSDCTLLPGNYWLVFNCDTIPETPCHGSMLAEVGLLNAADAYAYNLDLNGFWIRFVDPEEGAIGVRLEGIPVPHTVGIPAFPPIFLICTAILLLLSAWREYWKNNV